MGYIEDILESFNIDPKADKDPSVDINLSTIRTVINHDAYNVGNFLKRLLMRIHLVDNFRADGIAYAQYLPNIRRINIVINPFMLWEMILRKNVVIRPGVNKNEINQIDKLMIKAVKQGGWTKDDFNNWIAFLTSDSVCKLNSERENDFVNSLLSVIIHEMMHILWNHTTPQRIPEADKEKDENGKEVENEIEKAYLKRLDNIAKDFAINQTLRFGILDDMFMTVKNKTLLFSFYKGGAEMGIKKTDIDPNKAEKEIQIDWFEAHSFLNQPFEYYLNLLKSCSDADIKKLIDKKMFVGVITGVSADIYDIFNHEEQFEDFNDQTSDMKKVAQNDLKRVIDDMLEKGEINDIDDLTKQHPFKLNSYFAKIIEGLYPTETLSWEHILEHYVRKALGAEDNSYSMNRESRSMEGMFPGKQRLEGMDLNIIVDVSGSICHDEFNRFVNEIEKIAKDVDTPFVRYMQFHSHIALDEVVPLQSIRGIGIKSTGGTHMASGLNKLLEDNNKALTIVFTDGMVEESTKQEDYNYDIILFVSASGSGYCAEGLRKRGFRVVHQDGDNTWFNNA